MKKRCILIGGVGFLGMNIARGMLNAGYDVVIIDRRPLIPDHFFNFTKDIPFFLVDYKDSQKLENIFKTNDVLFHLAYSTLPGTSPDEMDDDVKENVFESIKLFKTAIKKGIKKIIFPSSGGTVYGERLDFPIKEEAPTNPICSYGITKLMIEKYILFLNRIYGIDYLIYRISNPYGKGQRGYREQGLIANVIAKMLNNSQITVFGDDQMVRDYIYISDVIDAFVLSMTKDIKNDIFNIGTGQGYSIKEIIDLVSEIVGIKPKITYVNKRPIDVKINILDPSKFQSLAGWKAKVSIEEGIRNTYEWIKNVI